MPPVRARSAAALTHPAARFAVALVLAVLCGTVDAGAELLPIRRYTTADGLGYDRVKSITRDSKGFVWFCTAEGLSRFDGGGFTTWSTQHGLPHSSINDIVERRDGSYWVATNGGGVARLTREP